MAEKNLPVVAWIEGEDDAARLVPAKTMHSAKRAGGTALTALQGYQPLVRLSDAQAAVAQWRDAVDAELMQIESTVGSFRTPQEAIRALIDFYVLADRRVLQQENERLRAENVRLIEDRARFPDRPDWVGQMIGSRFRNLEAAAKSSEDAWRRAQLHADVHAADKARMDWVIHNISGKAWRAVGITYGDSSEIRGRIDAALAATQDKGQEP